MSKVGLILVRLFIVLVGYGIAALAASLFVHLLVWPAIMPQDDALGWLLPFSIPLVALFASYVAFLPGALLIGLSEMRGYRSWLYHALSGGTAAFTGLVLVRVIHGRGIGPPAPDAYGEVPLMYDPYSTAAAVAAGFVGGIAYWLVAGRTAGRWGSDTARSG